MRPKFLARTRWSPSTPARPLGLFSRVLVSLGLAGLIGAYLFVTLVPLLSGPDTTFTTPTGYGTTPALAASYVLADAELIPSDSWQFVGAESQADCGLTAAGKLLDQFPLRADQSGLGVLIVKDGAGG